MANSVIGSSGSFIPRTPEPFSGHHRRWSDRRCIGSRLCDRRVQSPQAPSRSAIHCQRYSLLEVVYRWHEDGRPWNHPAFRHRARCRNGLLSGQPQTHIPGQPCSPWPHLRRPGLSSCIPRSCHSRLTQKNPRISSIRPSSSSSTHRNGRSFRVHTSNAITSLRGRR